MHISEEEIEDRYQEYLNEFIDKQWNNRFEHPRIKVMLQKAEQMEQEAEVARELGADNADELADIWWEYSEMVADKASELYFANQDEVCSSAEEYAERKVEEFLARFH